MQVLTEQFDLDRFLRGLAATTSRTLLLDYDGTIAPFRPQRDRARPHPDLATALNAILETDCTRVVIVSGRAIDDLVPLLADLVTVPELWGSHGWERLRADGTRDAIPLPASARTALDAARLAARSAGVDDLCEIKPAGIALHWRGHDDSRVCELQELAKQIWTPFARHQQPENATHREESTTPLDWHEFDGGIELRATGRDKGYAVRTLLQELDEDAVVAYAGDDATDEDAFAALAARGLSILVRSKLRETRAQLWINSHESLARFLTRWKDQCTTDV